MPGTWGAPEMRVGAWQAGLRTASAICNALILLVGLWRAPLKPPRPCVGVFKLKGSSEEATEEKLGP